MMKTNTTNTTATANTTTTAVKKPTKKQMFQAIIQIMQSGEMPEDVTTIVTFAEHEIELLDKKQSSNSKTKGQIENEGIMTDILDALAGLDHGVTVTELQKEVPTMAEYSNQKLSSLLKKLVESGEVVKTTDKKKSYFSLAK